MNPTIERRLKSDYTKTRTLIEQSGGGLRLIKVDGDPPQVYTIEYHCPSLVIDTQGELVTRNTHIVEIKLGSDYPIERPSARMLTPVFNPHVFRSLNICLGGVWNPSETLESLILRIGALLQLDPKVLDVKSPANSDANNWVKKNWGKLPLGKVDFKVATPPEKRIQWF